MLALPSPLRLSSQHFWPEHLLFRALARSQMSAKDIIMARGIMIALPVSVLMWSVIGAGCYAAFHLVPTQRFEMTAR